MKRFETPKYNWNDIIPVSRGGKNKIKRAETPSYPIDLEDFEFEMEKYIMKWTKLSDEAPTKSVGDKVLLYRIPVISQTSQAISIHSTKMVKYCNINETWWMPLPDPPKTEETKND